MGTTDSLVERYATYEVHFSCRTREEVTHAQELMAIPEMKEFGSVLKSSPLIELTEAETEYVVSVIKHIFKEHVVFQVRIYLLPVHGRR